MSKSLTIIYALQSSLDFEKGGEIAENLFRLYEYARQQIINDSKTGEAAGTLVAMASLEDIREAWVEIRSIL
jgi:flagellar protein FliS